MNYPKPNTFSSILVRNTLTYISVPGYKFNLVLSGEFTAVNNISDPYQINYGASMVGLALTSDVDNDEWWYRFNNYRWQQPMRKPEIIRKQPDLSGFKFDSELKQPSLIHKIFSRIIGAFFIVMILPMLLSFSKK